MKIFHFLFLFFTLLGGSFAQSSAVNSPWSGLISVQDRCVMAPSEAPSSFFSRLLKLPYTGLNLNKNSTPSTNPSFRLHPFVEESPQVCPGTFFLSPKDHSLTSSYSLLIPPSLTPLPLVKVSPQDPRWLAYRRDVERAVQNHLNKMPPIKLKLKPTLSFDVYEGFQGHDGKPKLVFEARSLMNLETVRRGDFSVVGLLDPHDSRIEFVVLDVATTSESDTLNLHSFLGSVRTLKDPFISTLAISSVYYEGSFTNLYEFSPRERSWNSVMNCGCGL